MRCLFMFSFEKQSRMSASTSSRISRLSFVAKNVLRMKSGTKPVRSSAVFRRISRASASVGAGGAGGPILLPGKIVALMFFRVSGNEGGCEDVGLEVVKEKPMEKKDVSRAIEKEKDKLRRSTRAGRSINIWSRKIKLSSSSEACKESVMSMRSQPAGGRFVVEHSPHTPPATAAAQETTNNASSFSHRSDEP